MCSSTLMSMNPVSMNNPASMHAVELIPSLLESDPVSLQKRMQTIRVLREAEKIRRVQVDVVDSAFTHTKSNQLPIREVCVFLAKEGLSMDLHDMSPITQEARNDWIAEFDRAQQLHAAQELNMRLFLHQSVVHDVHTELVVFKRSFTVVSECWLVLGFNESIRADLVGIDGIMVMGVEPGASGRPFQSQALDQLQEVRRRYPTLPCMIDGGVSVETIALIVQAGATSCAVGSALESNADPIEAFNALVAAAAV